MARTKQAVNTNSAVGIHKQTDVVDITGEDTGVKEEVPSGCLD
jgi:hypothetical protein